MKWIGTVKSAHPKTLGSFFFANYSHSNIYQQYVKQLSSLYGLICSCQCYAILLRKQLQFFTRYCSGHRRVFLSKQENTYKNSSTYWQVTPAIPKCANNAGASPHSSLTDRTLHTGLLTTTWAIVSNSLAVSRYTKFMVFPWGRPRSIFDCCFYELATDFTCSSKTSPWSWILSKQTFVPNPRRRSKPAL